MAQQYKIEEVQKIKERLENAKSIVLVDYKGINIEEVDELRNRFRNAEVDYFISKNTFIKIALNDLGIKELDSYLVGPTAVASCKEDEVAPARELKKFNKEVMEEKDFPKFKIGFVAGKVMDVDKLNQLADLPSKEALLSMVLQGFNAPISGLVGVLHGVLRKFVYAVDAVAKEKEKN
ncbi:MAG: 50S ribosomal protein L10 [Candidatus Cloacimonetes bacterium]|nr:50S ribosomal protein L10 [Candidatus Cloacimonadota bacterium]MCF7814954.1 50S ribosomal protein L10 [Candidatus Cloacimonadota bacterium]MCF7869234.1 50S ribosomal protein L10 [Candidatus Cloacimonadota bacterium]MCF7884651.1 50S ribosomal protein L10 [Candidatus Cloacimonadota bacterium]